MEAGWWDSVGKLGSWKCESVEGGWIHGMRCEGEPLKFSTKAAVICREPDTGQDGALQLDTGSQWSACMYMQSMYIQIHADKHTTLHI